MRVHIKDVKSYISLIFCYSHSKLPQLVRKKNISRSKAESVSLDPKYPNDFFVKPFEINMFAFLLFPIFFLFVHTNSLYAIFIIAKTTKWNGNPRKFRNACNAYSILKTY